MRTRLNALSSKLSASSSVRATTTYPVLPSLFPLGRALPKPSGMELLRCGLKTQGSELFSPNGCSLEIPKPECIFLPSPDCKLNGRHGATLIKVETAGSGP